jgi:hypothetical protein
MTALRLSLIALILAAAPARGQGWEVLPVDDSRAGPVALVCPLDDAETGNTFCFSLGCADGGPLHYQIAYAGGAPLDPPLVGVDVDGQPLTTLAFEPLPDENAYLYRAAYDASAHRELIARLRLGNRAALVLGFGGEILTRDISLRGSGRAIGAVLDACPLPLVPLKDPAAQVLEQIEAECEALGGTVALEPGYERAEDLDDDGRTDMVIDFAAAVCSEMASLHCGSGGCTVGFYLNRETEYQPLFVDVIRGYDSAPGGILTLDLHGSFCGLFGYEACLRRFDITTGELVLLDQLTGEAAIAVLEGAPMPSLEPATPPEVGAVVAALDVSPASAIQPDMPDTGPGTEVWLVALAPEIAAPVPPATEPVPDSVPPVVATALLSDPAAPMIAIAIASLAPPPDDTAPQTRPFARRAAFAPPEAAAAPPMIETLPESTPPLRVIAADDGELPIYPETGESLDLADLATPEDTLEGGGPILTSPEADTTGADRLGLGQTVKRAPPPPPLTMNGVDDDKGKDDARAPQP